MSDNDNDHKYEGIWSFIVLIFIIVIFSGILLYNMSADEGSGIAIGVSIVAIIVFLSIWIFGLVGEARYWPAAENSCRDEPCLHDGKCENDYFDGYNCTCTEDWKGDNCETVSDIGLSKRPCEQDPNPCYHDAKCTDIDKNNDGTFEDYECECPEINGHPDSLKWKGTNCNTFPDDIDVNDYDIYCFKDVNKTEKQKEYAVPCESTSECFPKENLMDNCPEFCESSETHIWCDDDLYTGPGSRCMDRLNSQQVERCDSVMDELIEQDLEEQDEIDYLIQKCRNDPSTTWKNTDKACFCNSNLNCSSITTSGECIDAHCCDWNGSNCSNRYSSNYPFSMQNMENYYDHPRRPGRRGRGRHNNNRRGGGRHNNNIGTGRRNR